MGTRIFTLKVLLVGLLALALFAPGAYAFGAGDIPDFAFLQDKAYRHGDIENTLEYIVRWASGGHRGGHGGGLLGAAVGFLAEAATGGGPKFSKIDVKRVYFGNWLRDYSQAMDVAGLSKATADTIILVLSILGFMTFGYATEEFKLTAERLGVYLPVEHIDNPKGYADTPEPPHKFHPKLRGPLDPRELEIDPRTGMKNYIAREGESYDTSAAHVRRSLEKVIELARRSGGRDCPDLFEAYRLMGGALHTLEDLLAHSNWIELSLKRMGYNEVFCHVGDSALIEVSSGQGRGERVPPLVTGTFGSADFIFSVMGEATDHLSESSITDLGKKISNAKQKESPIQLITTILGRLPSSEGGESNQQKVQKAEEIQKNAYNFNPNDYTTEQVQRQFLDLLVWRDGVMRDVSKVVQGIPGLSDLMEQLTEALNVYVYTILQPYLTPILETATSALGDGSRAVIDKDDQYQVFEDPRASDPSHSMLSKDHFDNILNEPAGKIAKVVVELTVNKLVAAWSDESIDVRRTIDEILTTFHHPYFATGQSEFQNGMSQTLRKWLEGLNEHDRQETLRRLSKDHVKDGQNKRLGAAADTVMHSHQVGKKNKTSTAGGYGGVSGGYGQSPQTQGGYGQSGGQSGGGGYGQSPQTQGGYGQSGGQSGGGGYGQSQSGGHGGYGQTKSQGASQGGTYGSQGTGYGGQESSGYGQSKQTGYEGSRPSGYGQSQTTYGQTGSPSAGYGSGGGYGQTQTSTGGHGDNTYGAASGYGSGRQQGETARSGGGYGSSGGYEHQTHQQQSPEYGGSGDSYKKQHHDDDADRNKHKKKDDDDDKHRYGGGRKKDDDDDDNRGGYGFGKREDRDDSSGYGRQQGGGGSYGGGRDEGHGREERRPQAGYGESTGHGGSGGGYGGGRDEKYRRSGRDDDDDDDDGHKHGKHHKRDDDETYGVEGINLGDRSSYGKSTISHGREEEKKKEKEKKKKNRKDDDDDDDDNDNDKERKAYKSVEKEYGSEDEDKKKKKHGKKHGYDD